jgi:3',5'-cyclic AMP phosphodiesterase CpdA
VGEVLKLDPKPVGAVIDGDLAYKTGTAAEYTLFSKTIEPIRKAGIPLHLGLGNHDHFERFSSGLAMHRPKDQLVDGEQVLIVELPRANLIVLDSYDPKNTVAGKLGEDQVKWLAAALDARKEKPAIVFAHHNLQDQPDKNGRWGGLIDTTALWPILKARSQVKAYVFGHSHTWRLAERDGIHLINLPAIGYPFAKNEVTGWVEARLKQNGIALEVRALDPKHAKHGEKVELKWRKG